MLQVGSTPDESTSSDYDVIANDLRQLADQAAAQEPPVRMYERSLLERSTRNTNISTVRMNCGLGVLTCTSPWSRLHLGGYTAHPDL